MQVKTLIQDGSRYVYFLPQEDISYAKKRNEECFAPYSTHAKFSSDLLF